jgi:hypothetical protein
MRHLSFILALALPLAGCVVEANGNNNIVNQNDAGQGVDAGPDAAVDAAQNNNNHQWQPPTNSRVYVHTNDTLFYIDPGVSADLVEIGPFTGPCETGSGMYDIAIDMYQNIVGIAEEALYAVDKDTAACTLLFAFPEGSPHFFSLSFVKGAYPAEPDTDWLIAASAEEGEWVHINYPADTIAEAFHRLGYYDSPAKEWRSSGDIVSVQIGPSEYVTYATLKCPNYEVGTDCESDWLAEIDPDTGDARLIGPTGYTRLFGLGYWGDKVYGFNNRGDYVLIDVETGEATLEANYSELLFWGAGTTTRPFIVD